MKVRELMTTSVASCTPDTSLAAAGVAMWQHDCGLLPVVSHGRTVGVVTDRDICMAVSTQGRPASDIPARHVLDAQVALHTIGPDETVAAALELMARHGIRRLPVVGPDGALEGVVSINDIILAAQNVRAGASRVSYEPLMETLKAICRHHGDAGAPAGSASASAPAPRPRASRSRKKA